MLSIFGYGETLKVTATVRSNPDTTARIQLWCHDIAPNNKNRFTEPFTPKSEWEDVSLLYTNTQSPNLRIYLSFYPGAGRILVDKVVVEKLPT